MSLKKAKVVVGSATPPRTSASTAQPGTRHLHSPSPNRPLDPERLQEIQEGILQHNLKCQDVQAHLNSERQRLHRVAVKYGLSTNLWTAIVLMIPVLLLEASHVSGFLVYDCFLNQLKTQTINITAPKECKDPSEETELKIIMTDGDLPIMATQCLVLKSQEVFSCGGPPSFHYRLAKIVINLPVEVTPLKCRDALTTGKITVQWAEDGLQGRAQLFPPALHRGRKGRQRHVLNQDLREEGGDVREVVQGDNNQDPHLQGQWHQAGRHNQVPQRAHCPTLGWSCQGCP
jgi:hypothetical protein